MKFQLFSDIHIEFTENTYPKIKPKEPYLILAGDIGKISMDNFKEFIKYCSENWLIVLYVFGNHEFYSRHSMGSIISKFEIFFSKFQNVHLLNNSSFILEDITIYGFTGWTRPIFTVTSDAREYLNDYNMIRTKKSKFRIEDHANIANEQIEKFKEFLSVTDSNKILIITHFPPIKGTSNPRFNNDICSNYFSWTNLLKEENILTDKIKLWCSGHTHWSYDFIKNDIRYISNQIGYVSEDIPFSEEGIFELI